MKVIVRFMPAIVHTNGSAYSSEYAEVQKIETDHALGFYILRGSKMDYYIKADLIMWMNVCKTVE